MQHRSPFIIYIFSVLGVSFFFIIVFFYYYSSFYLLSYHFRSRLCYAKMGSFGAALLADYILATCSLSR